jgi:hypothetical protein
VVVGMDIDVRSSCRVVVDSASDISNGKFVVVASVFDIE